MTQQDRIRLEGRIAGAGFSSGDRFVAGLWRRGPLGPMIDVMWAKPSGHRTLLASSDDVARFVGGVYRFEQTLVVTTKLEERAGTIDLAAGPLQLHLETGPRLKLFSLRPLRLRRSPAWVRVEDALFRPLAGRILLRGGTGTRLYGRSPSGVREWYCIDAFRPVVRASASLEGEDLGRLTPLVPPARFGFSEFPQRAAVVDCAPVLEGAERFLPQSVNAREGDAPRAIAEPSRPSRSRP